MINYLAILISAIVMFVIGALWYGPLFGKTWRGLMGYQEGSMGTSSGMKMTSAQAMTGGFIATLVMAWVLDNLIAQSLVVTVGDALVFAFWIWLGFVATIMLNSVFYESRPWKLYFINVLHYLVVLLAGAAILVWWPW